jgi:hypothetical protein
MLARARGLTIAEMDVCCDQDSQELPHPANGTAARVERGGGSWGSHGSAKIRNVRNVFETTLQHLTLNVAMFPTFSSATCFVGLVVVAAASTWGR